MDKKAKKIVKSKKTEGQKEGIGARVTMREKERLKEKNKNEVSIFHNSVC